MKIKLSNSYFSNKKFGSTSESNYVLNDILSIDTWFLCLKIFEKITESKKSYFRQKMFKIRIENTDKSYLG